MSVFETWISAGNAHLSHMMIDEKDVGDAPRVAWIDHAYSLSQQWGPKNILPRNVAWYLPGFTPNQKVKKEVADKIGGVRNEQIEKIVSRIKPKWLNLDRCNLIIAKLKERRDTINKLCTVSPTEQQQAYYHSWRDFLSDRQTYHS